MALPDDSTAQSTKHHLAHSQYDVEAYFGGVPGASDNSGPIQDAIDAASVSGQGDVVYLGSGIWNAAGLTLPVYPTPITIRGDGFSSVLRLKNSANQNLLQTAGFSGLSGSASQGGSWRTNIRDLLIDGNKANNTSGHGLAVYGWANRFKNLIIQNCAGSGLWTEWGPGDRSGGDVDTSMSNYVANLDTMNNGGDGWTHRGPHDTVAEFINAKASAGWGIKVEIPTASYNANGFHGRSINCWNNGTIAGMANGGGFYAGSGCAVYDLASSANATHAALYFPDSAGASIFGGGNWAGGTGIYVGASSQHRIEGIVQNCSVTGIQIDGSAGSVFYITAANIPGPIITFTDDQGANRFEGTATIPAGGSLSTGTRSVATMLNVRTQGTVDSELVTIGSNVATLGFYGATPGPKPTITGSRGGNAALADLLTEGATLGLWIDSTTA